MSGSRWRKPTTTALPCLALPDEQNLGLKITKEELERVDPQDSLDKLEDCFFWVAQARDKAINEEMEAATAARRLVRRLPLVHAN